MQEVDHAPSNIIKRSSPEIATKRREHLKRYLQDIENADKTHIFKNYLVVFRDGTRLRLSLSEDGVEEYLNKGCLLFREGDTEK